MPISACVKLVPPGVPTLGAVRRRWNAYELAVGPNTVRSTAKGSGRVTIQRAEITSIVEDSDSGSMPRSRSPICAATGDQPAGG